MEDYQIVDLFWQRSEAAIRESERKYGRILLSASRSLLDSREDAEECVSDTRLQAWNRMPQDRPAYLGAYLVKIVRALSISRFRSLHRQKRGGAGCLTDELTDCIPDGSDLQAEYENGRLAQTINRFVQSLDEEKQRVFVRRYFFSDSIEEISASMGIGKSKVKTMLFRLRGELKSVLEGEDLL